MASSGADLSQTKEIHSLFLNSLQKGRSGCRFSQSLWPQEAPASEPSPLPGLPAHHPKGLIGTETSWRCLGLPQCQPKKKTNQFLGIRTQEYEFMRVRIHAREYMPKTTFVQVSVFWQHAAACAIRTLGKLVVGQRHLRVVLACVWLPWPA